MAVYQEEAAGGIRFTVRRNCALNWRGTKRLFWFFACCLAVAAGYFASLGAWLVLPFVGLELFVLGVALYLSAVAGHRRELIEVDDAELRVLRGGRRLREIARLPRYWTHVSLRRDPTGWYPGRLFLYCHGKRLEIGAELVDGEREGLAADLDLLLGFRQPCGSQRVLVPIPAGLASPLHSGRGVLAVVDADAHAMKGFSLSPEAERQATCARGAFQEK